MTSAKWVPIVIAALVAAVTYAVFAISIEQWSFVTTAMVSALVIAELMAGILASLNTLTSGPRASGAFSAVGIGGLAVFAMVALSLGLVFKLLDIDPAYDWIYTATLLIVGALVIILTLAMAPADVARQRDIETQKGNKAAVRITAVALAMYRNLLNEAVSAQLVAPLEIEEVVRRIRRLETKLEVIAVMRGSQTQQQLLGQLGDQLADLQSQTDGMSIDSVGASIAGVSQQLARIEQLCLSLEGAQ